MHFISQGNTEEIVEASSVDSAIQQVVGSGGQRVITIVTDGVPLGTLQTAVPTSSLSQPFIVTMEDGQQGTEELSLESCKAALRINFKKKKTTGGCKPRRATQGRLFVWLGLSAVWYNNQIPA